MLEGFPVKLIFGFLFLIGIAVFIWKFVYPRVKTFINAAVEQQ